MSNKPKVIVCQHGARHRYAVPRILEQAGMLEALYTDSCEHSLLGKIAKVMGPLGRGSLKRLANRKVIGVPHEKVCATDIPTYRYRVTKKGESKADDYLLVHESMNKELIEFGVRDADTLYCFEGENLGFIRYAKEKGLGIILDVCTSPLAGKIVRDERVRYDTNISVDELDEFIKVREQYFKSQAGIADILLCPSEFVADGARDVAPEHTDKIKICPYGSSIDYGGRVNDPVKGRFFWAGGDWVLKGLHYLAKAADELKKKYPAMEFRAAGITEPSIINKSEFKNIHFLGKLDKKQMQEQFLSADMFVFPTLSEGMAGVVIEAITAGCPVITTRCAGIDAIENGKNSILIPPRNPSAIIEAIEGVYCKREFWNTLAENTRALAANYTLDAWRERLVAILNEL